MRLFALTLITMIGFSANSLLNRMALIEPAIGPSEFASIRIAAGALVLLGLLALRDRGFPQPHAPHLLAVGSLTVYMLGFSFAYVSMDAGLGALVLFAVVQVTMFGGALAGGDRPPAQRWAGMLLALGGLAWLCWPGQTVSPEPFAILMMTAAAVGWGLYSLIGRSVTDPLAATGWNFVYATPLVLLALSLPTGSAAETSARGVWLAMLSGGVTSALAYSMWYALLPRLGASVGALAQLSVPVFALILRVLILGEALTAQAVGAAALILTGIAIGLVGSRRAG